jgi:hypothetical protein
MRLNLQKVVAVSLLLGLLLALTLRFTTGPGGAAGAPATRSSGILVTSADFKPLAPTGPGAVVLRWWQSNQFNEPPRRTARFYASSHRPALQNLRADLGVMVYVFRETKPLVVDEYVSGTTAQVFTIIPPLRKTASADGGLPYIFHLAREGGQWKLADDFIANRAAGERAFAAQQDRP